MTETEIETVNTLASAPASAPIEDGVDMIQKEIGKATDRFDNFLTFAGLQKKEYQTEGIRFCLRNELASESLPHQVRGGIVADEMGLGKTIMMIGLILANFQKRTLIVLPVALLKQWEQQILKNTGHQALVFYGEEKKESRNKCSKAHQSLLPHTVTWFADHLPQLHTKMYRIRHTLTLARIGFMV